jgi:non-ribosomal peptide synthetase component E (peptide arylation enzyme)
MILNDPRGRPAINTLGGRAALDDLLRRAAKRRPNDIALVDPPNREAFTDGKPRRLTYAQADRAVSAIAGRLRRIGLHTDAIVGVQIANTVEGVLTLLGIFRAGLIAMPLPLLWRRADAVAALGRVGAGALVVSGRIGEVDHYQLAMQVAAEIFPIRYICAFGGRRPDGIIPLDDLFAIDKLDPIPPFDAARAQNPGAHLALITWDVGSGGLIPVGRSHAELIAGGLSVLLESRIEQDAVILSTMTLSSFAGIATALLPWLLVGGTLVLHHPFDSAAFVGQRRDEACEAAIVPGPLIAPLAEAGHLTPHDGLSRVIGVWRAPEKLARAQAWRDQHIALIDVQVFGETGLVASRRGQNGKPAPVPFGTMFAPRGARGAIAVGEIVATPTGTIALRGPMVPRAPFPPGAERSTRPYFKVAQSGYVDTGYACRIEREASAMVVTGPPPGIVSVGGYRFVARELQDLVGGADGVGMLAVLPDALAGHQLAGSANDRGALQESLARQGVNPLLVGAFRDRHRPAA